MQFSFVGLFILCTTIQGFSQEPQPATIENNNPTEEEILDALRGAGFQEMILEIADGDGIVVGAQGQIAIFSGGDAAGLGMDEGILFSTGDAITDLGQRNEERDVSNAMQYGTHDDLDLLGIFNDAKYDVVIYKFKVTLEDYTSAIRVEFQFGSDEYPDYVGSRFNDAFGFFIRPIGNGATLPGNASVINMARLPQSNNPISINTVNYGYAGANGNTTYPGLDLGQAEYYLRNGHTTSVASDGRLLQNTNTDTAPIYIEYNGLTKLITYDLINLTPGGKYEFKIAIADAGDRSYDSGVLIKKIHGTTGADVKIEKTINMMDPGYNDEIKFTLTASNLGPYDAEGTIVNDLLPSGYTFVSHTASKGTYNPTTGVWDIGDLQAIHEIVTLEITATVNESGEYTNITTITSDDPDPNLDNNLAKITPNPLCFEELIFYEDFGVSDADSNAGRTTTPYMPIDSYAFATPFPTSSNNNEIKIGPGHYAVVAPSYIKEGWDPNDLNDYNWTPGILEAGAVTDISGTSTGAVLAVNTNTDLDVFYQREQTLDYDDTYRLSLWMYLLEGPAKIAVDIKSKSTGQILGTFATDVIEDTGVEKNKWSNVQLYFKVPPLIDLNCEIGDVVIEIRNDLPNSAGSRYYIDNIGLTQLGADCPMPADSINIYCPPLIITNPILINQAQ